ncbi:hypothetical protein [Flavobacterium alvei]|uniref:hypothetical protein n=1 Tax=Flavobacterium alvei TaxID=2080416 RepID=UPI0026F32ED8|nr:hypothetical protein [Flavobacterium alvei]
MEKSPKINLDEQKKAVQTNCPKKISTKKWDKRLADFKNYTKEYLKQYKKSLKGNFVSFCKYPYLKAKSEALYEELNEAQSQGILTEKQLIQKSKTEIKIGSTPSTQV